MANSTLQSATLLPKHQKLPVGEATEPGDQLTTPLTGPTVDISGYARRDRELQWRDLVVAKAVEEISRRAATVFGIPIKFPLASKPDTFIDHSSDVTYPASESSAIGVSNIEVKFVGLTGPIARGTVEVSIVDETTNPPVIISQSSDDGKRSIIPTGKPTDVDGVTPQGGVVGGVINYERGQVAVSIKPHQTKQLQCYVSYQYSANLRFGALIPAGGTVYSDVLTFTPIARNSVTLTVDSSVTQDDGQGHLTHNGVVRGGSIDYTTGQVELHLSATETDKSVVISYKQMQYLKQDQQDLSSTQAASAPGGVTGVRYVDNQSLPQDALVSDQDLYQRDLVLFQVLSKADELFKSATGWDPAKADATIKSISGATISDAWSKAEAKQTYAVPQYNMRWGPEVYGNADRYLAWRDNVLAPYVADLSCKLACFHKYRSELQALKNPDGSNILLDD